MPEDSAPTSRPDPDPDPDQEITPDEATTLDKPVTSPRKKPSTTRKPRKPRARQPAQAPTGIDETVPAEAASKLDTPKAAEAPAITPHEAAEIAAPEVVDTATLSATPDAGDRAESATSEVVETAEKTPTPAAVDPAPDHAPPAVVPTAKSATPITASADGAEGPVTLAQALASDGVRRVIVTISYLVSLVGALAAFGVVDSRSRRLSEVLTPTLSLLAAATQADRLWWVVLLGLAVYVGWLWLPGNAADPRSRAMAYPSAITMTILGIWFFLIRGGELLGGALVSLLVVGSLMVTLRAAATVPGRGFICRQCAQLGFAAALGWMTVLTAGAIAGALVTHQVPAYFVSAETWGILGTTALLGVGMAMVRYFPGRLYIAAALSWGFVCIAYARVIGQPRSYFIGVVALVSALLILIAGVAVFLWARGRVRERVS